MWPDANGIARRGNGIVHAFNEVLFAHDLSRFIWSDFADYRGTPFISFFVPSGAFGPIFGPGAGIWRFIAFSTSLIAPLQKYIRDMGANASAGYSFGLAIEPPICLSFFVARKSPFKSAAFPLPAHRAQVEQYSGLIHGFERRLASEIVQGPSALPVAHPVRFLPNDAASFANTATRVLPPSWVLHLQVWYSLFSLCSQNFFVMIC